MSDEWQREASPAGGGGEVANRAGGSGRLDLDQRAMPLGGDQPDAVLRLEEAALELGDAGIREQRGPEFQRP